jgi:hypothetical protein
VAYRLIAEGEDVEPTEATEHDLIYGGTVGIIDPPRPEVAVAIADAHVIRGWNRQRSAKTSTRRNAHCDYMDATPNGKPRNGLRTQVAVIIQY